MRKRGDHELWQYEVLRKVLALLPRRNSTVSSDDNREAHGGESIRETSARPVKLPGHIRRAAILIKARRRRSATLGRAKKLGGSTMRNYRSMARGKSGEI